MALDFYKVARLATVFTASVGLLAGCGPRVEQTEVAIKTTGWGEKVMVDTEPGKKCYFGCYPGEEYVKLTKGEQSLFVVGIQPDQNVEKNFPGASYGVIKVLEGLPLSGNIQIIVKIDITEKNKKELENLYKAIPPKSGEDDEEYMTRIKFRLATLALDEVQNVYGSVSVKDATRTNLQDKETESPVKILTDKVIQNTQKRMKDSGFGFIVIKDVILAGVNLGPQAEAANQRIAMAGIEQTVAGEQMKAAQKVQEAANKMASITADELKSLRAVAGEGQSLSELYCLHKVARDPNFASKNPNCFPGGVVLSR